MNKTFKITALTALTVIMMPWSTAHAQIGGSNDPCPVPREAMSNTPNSMAKIQEDITRFTLCVERAQLLDRLNALVENNIETIDSVLLQPQTLPPLPTEGNVADNQNSGNMTGMPGGGNSSGGNSSGGNAGGNSPAPIDEASLITDDPAQMGGEGGMPGMEEEMEPEDPIWLIREINGRAGSLHANLVNSEGMLKRVQQGDNLPDDSRIIEISPTTVRIKKEQEVISLDWVAPTQGTGE